MTVRDLVILGCSSQQPTRYRNHGAYLFRWNNEGLLFDPGEGTQRQFIFANIAPPVVTRIFVSHFHGDHCLGVGSMLMRLNLDKVTHNIHCYYPASGKAYFDRLRYGTIYHEMINVIEHPINEAGVVHDDGKFCVEATFLDHSSETIGWKVTEASERKYDREKLQTYKVKGPLVRELQEKKQLTIEGKNVTLDDVSQIRKGESIAIVMDTRYCQEAVDIAKNARILLCESTYLDQDLERAERYRHLTAKQAGLIAKKANVETLILSHFSARYSDEQVFAEEAKTNFPNSHAAHDLAVFPFPKLKM